LQELIADQAADIRRDESIQGAEHMIGETIDRKDTRQRQAIVLERALRRAPDQAAN